MSTNVDLGYTNILKSEIKLSQPVVNFINILHRNFSYQHCFGSFFQLHVSRKSCQNDVRTKNLYVKR